jgi:hypothetical protein
VIAARRVGALAALATSCTWLTTCVPNADVGRVPPRASPELWWSPSLKLASLSEIPQALARPFDYPFDVVATSSSGETLQATMANCTDYLALRVKQYEAATQNDFTAMKLEGSRCHALTALQNARPGSQPTIPAPLLSDSALSMLPPALGPEATPADRERRENATHAGTSWQTLDPDAVIVSKGPRAAAVSGSDWTTQLEVLAQADFDGDGREEVLLSTVSYGREGSWREVRLRLLSRAPGSPTLAVVGELQL